MDSIANAAFYMSLLLQPNTGLFVQLSSLYKLFKAEIKGAAHMEQPSFNSTLTPILKRAHKVISFFL